MRTYYVAHETQLSALWCPKQEGNPKKWGDIYIYRYIYRYRYIYSFAIQHKLTQHCKATVL